MDLQHLGVVGAGTMGSGIAQVCAMAGRDVTMVDVDNTALDKGIRAIEASLDRLIKKGQLSEAQRDAALGRITATVDYEHLSHMDIVIEAATENLELKLRILQKLDGMLVKGAIIATNTSSLSITQLAAVVARPERVIGMHFFNPVPMMALVEIIRGLQTSDDTLQSVRSLCEAIGKTPIEVRNSPGFVVNRILCPMINEAVFVLQEGIAGAEEIDAGMKLGCGQPLGPLALADLIGLDTMLAIMQVLHEGLGDPKYRPAPLLREMVQAGRLGRKSGRGFFSYA